MSELAPTGMPDGRVVAANAASGAACLRPATDAQAVSRAATSYWLALLGSALLGLLRPKRALLVLRLRSIAARRASTCWACLLCGPCAFPPTPPEAAKCVGIVRLPAAVDIVAICFPPGVARVVGYCSI